MQQGDHQRKGKTSTRVGWAIILALSVTTALPYAASAGVGMPCCAYTGVGWDNVFQNISILVGKGDGPCGNSDPSTYQLYGVVYTCTQCVASDRYFETDPASCANEPWGPPHSSAPKKRAKTELHTPVPERGEKKSPPLVKHH